MPNPLALDIDELGEIDRQLQLTKPLEARYKVLKEKLDLHFSDFDAEKPCTGRGNEYEVQLSPKRNERTVVDKKKIFGLLKKALTMDGLIALLEIPFGAAIDKYVPKSAQAGLIHEERSGYRTFTIVALKPVAPPKAA